MASVPRQRWYRALVLHIRGRAEGEHIGRLALQRRAAGACYRPGARLSVTGGEPVSLAHSCTRRLRSPMTGEGGLCG